jgi:SprT protein
MAEQGELFEDEPAPVEGASRSYQHPISGRDAALTLVARDLVRELGLPNLAESVVVDWNPRMRTAAGRAFSKDRRIELNSRLQSLPEDQREQELRNTFLHELAHLVAIERAGKKRIQPHGPEWKTACRDLGIPGEDRCHSLDFKPRRIARKYAYVCPHCSAVIHRVRRLSRRVACYPCCKTHAGGRYDARFQLVESKLK